MNNSPNIKQVETVLKYIKNELYSGRLQPGERLPAERRLADMLGVGRAHVRAAFQKLEFYGIVQTFPQSGTVVAQEKMQVLERMITDALQIRQYDFASLVYVRVLLEIEDIKLCATVRRRIWRTSNGRWRSARRNSIPRSVFRRTSPTTRRWPAGRTIR